jgi:hypothetical protein
MSSTSDQGSSTLNGQRIEARVSIAADHPSLPGHFPGEPVVPGVVLLDRLIAAAEASIGSTLCVIGMPQVKFLAPLLPDEEAHAVLEWVASDRAKSSVANNTGAPVRASAPPTSHSKAHAHCLNAKTTSADHDTSGAHRVPASLRFRVEREGKVIAQGAFDVAIESTH